ncbi:MAG: hypothetical protein R3A78_06345 [Polyangiales bacterium]
MRTSDVRICFVGPRARPAFLRPAVRDAAPALLTAERVSDSGERHVLEIKDGDVQLGGMSDDECVLLRVDMKRAMGTFRPVALERGSSWLVSTAYWFWAPSAPTHVDRARIAFEAPESMHVVPPFRAVEGPQGTVTYEAGADLFDFMGQIAVVPRAPIAFRTPDVDVRIATMDGELAVGPDEIRAWIGKAVSAVRSVGGRFPADRLTVIVVPVPVAKEPVVFGNVVRGGGPTITLYVSTHATAEELHANWVAVHELSHLLHPFTPEPWLAEGLATYYQEVLLARMGAQSEEAAWRALDEGFARGRADGTDFGSRTRVATCMTPTPTAACTGVVPHSRFEWTWHFAGPRRPCIRSMGSSRSSERETMPCARGPRANSLARGTDSRGSAFSNRCAIRGW